MRKIFKMDESEMELIKNSTIILLNKYKFMSKNKRNPEEYM
jgi:hypothetical protein